MIARRTAGLPIGTLSLASNWLTSNTLVVQSQSNCWLATGLIFGYRELPDPRLGLPEGLAGGPHWVGSDPSRRLSGLFRCLAHSRTPVDVNLREVHLRVRPETAIHQVKIHTISGHRFVGSKHQINESEPNIILQSPADKRMELCVAGASRDPRAPGPTLKLEMAWDQIVRTTEMRQA
jgi:hypothetical protein